jgi:hypothetical protein
LLRAAAVGGGAYMAGKAHARHQAEQQQVEDEQNARIDDVSYQQQQQQSQSYQQPSQPAPATAPAPPSMTDQLNQLATLHQQGALTDDEFTAAKAKLFGT